MPKQQTDLDSFFRAVSKGEQKSEQIKIDAYFGKKGGEATEKENKKRCREAAETKPKTSADVEYNAQESPHKTTKPKATFGAKRRRRVVEDSDDEKADVSRLATKGNPAASAISEDSKAGDDQEEEKTGNSVHTDKDRDVNASNASTLVADSDIKKRCFKEKGSYDACKEIEKTKFSSVMAKTAFSSQSSLAKAHYLPSDSCLPYSELCEAFESIEAITGRLQIQEIVTKLFRKQIDSGNPENLNPLMYLASSSVAPAFECVELGIGDALLIRAIAEAYGSNAKAVKAKYEDLGDLGLVAQNCKGKQKTLGGFFVTTKKESKKQWTCQEILAFFRDIAALKGGQSQKLKIDKIKKMLVGAANALEPKYIIRALQGKLRIGLAQSTVLISLAHAIAQSVPSKVKELCMKDSEEIQENSPEEARNYTDMKLTKEKRMEAAVAIVKKAYSQVPSYDVLIDAVLSCPLHKLHTQCTLKPGMPVAPMLAKPTKSVQEVLSRLNGQRFTCEYKYDGERAQVHMLPGGSTKVFSRNLLNTSDKFPEVPLFVKEAAGEEVESCVLDTEVVAYDSKKGKLVPFQVLSTRKKTEESAETAKVQVIVQAFDLMYLNGESLLGKALQERRDLMHKYFSAVEGKFTFAVSLDHEENGDTLVLEEFLEQAVKAQCEGLMVKTLDRNANYEPSKRSLNWLKLKKDYLEGMGDSVDLVPIGAYHGKGKRTGVYGAYLLACYDPDTEEFQSVCKIGTGFSDDSLKSLSASLNKHIIPKKASEYNVADQLECDVWFDSVQVWEIKAADLSKSSAHRGAVGKTGEEGRGIGLRFPRFERLRDDKRPFDATTSHQILDMYYNQDSVQGSGKGDDGDYGGI